MSDKTQDLRRYRQEMLAELTEHILPYWLDKVIDLDGDKFHGFVSGDDVADPTADKGIILTTRILWTFSRAYRQVRDERYLRAADLVYRFLKSHLLDAEQGGVFWTVDAHGAMVDTTKKFYGQAFATYALTEYAEAAGQPQALEEAKRLFDLIERHGRDRAQGGYIEALGRAWTPIQDTRLSLVDLNTPKSMNTNLHILEAYARLAKADPKGPVGEALESLVEVFLRHIVLPNRHFGLFFEMDWREVSGNLSYGHDIEGSWLLAEAAEVTGQERLVKAVVPVAVEMARVTIQEALDAEGGILNEREADGHVKSGKEWWMQSEAMVGFLNAYQLTGDELFLDKSLAVWEFCKRHFLRPTGEWYTHIDDQGAPDLKGPVVGPWKCPYHAARTCLEIVERIDHHLG